jgi:phage terminase small subunit
MAEEITREDLVPRIRLTPMQNAFVQGLVDDNTPYRWRSRRYLQSIAVNVGYSPQSVDKLINSEPQIWTAANYLLNDRPIDIFVDPNPGGRAVVGSKDLDEFRAPGEELASYRQEMFCQELVSDPQFNKRKAAQRAGYLNNGEYAFELYQNPKIKARIKELQAERKERLKSDADDVLMKLKLLSDANIIDFVKRWDNNSVVFEDSQTISRDVLYGVLSIKQTTRGVGRNQQEQFSIKLNDKHKSLALLAKHHGLLDDVSTMDPEEFAQDVRRAASLLGPKVPGGEI